MRSKYTVLGTTLVVLGLLVVLKLIGFITVSIFALWPIIIIWLGLEFERHALADPAKNAGEFVPGGILLCYGALFMLCSLFGWDLMGRLWPVFLLGPAFGLAQLYMATPNDKGTLLAAAIVGLPGLFFLLGSWLDFRVVLAVMLIGTGVAIIRGQKRGGKG